MKNSVRFLVITLFLIAILPVAAHDADAQTSCTAGQRTFSFINNYSSDVWVGVINGAGQSVPGSSWKWKLRESSTQTLCIPSNWTSGRLWARTDCSFDSSTIFYPTCTTSADCPSHNGVATSCYSGVCITTSCITNNDCIAFIGDNRAICDNQIPHEVADSSGGCRLNPACTLGDCKGVLNCADTAGGQSSGSNPTIIVEITTLTPSAGDTFDLSGVDGFGMAIEVDPVNNTSSTGCMNVGCMTAGADCPQPCTWNYQSTCPYELQIKDSSGSIIGCLGPQDYCSNNPKCKSGGDSCTLDTDCCSQSCPNGTCAAGNSLDCKKIYSIGKIACTKNSDCPPVSNYDACNSNPSICPSPTTCETSVVNPGPTNYTCQEACVNNVCQGIPCTKNDDCNSGPVLLGQGLGCDLNPASLTANTCQPTKASMYGCVGINHTSCMNTGTYGSTATWCCGCSSWQESKGECNAVSQYWQSAVEPIIGVFHNACATAYSFPYDDKVTMTCTSLTDDGSLGYNVTFSPKVATYTLSAYKSGIGKGTITSSPSGIDCGSTCSASFNSSTNITLTATPKTGSTFSGWSGACTGTSTTCTITMDASKNVTATFLPPSGLQTLTVTKIGAGSGTVTSSPAGINCGSTCSAGYNYDTQVTLTAASQDASSTFSGWSGGSCTETSPCTVVMDASQSVTAVFNDVSSNTYTIPLYTGWNLISIPLQSADMSVAKILNNISNNYTIVWEFTPPSIWKSYDPNDPTYSELQNLALGKGYWIKMNGLNTLTISGSNPSKTINLASGWNLIGYPKTSKTPVGTALQSIAGNYTIVWEFTPPSIWKSYDPNDPTYSELQNLAPGKGYWIKMINAGTLTFQ